ncbi:hypothetical protein PSEWESI4_01674 [Pseudomonas carbonaria]|uniref:Uncharacterized protein n=1 Tax=Zestomonas carbonaria TaxID=2762745 RepID=A0A7U7ELY5_9GAMM|nr:hypothetical protein PSEWESI4_01674 [Pseudomonas carbonaria]
MLCQERSGNYSIQVVSIYYGRKWWRLLWLKSSPTR